MWYVCSKGCILWCCYSVKLHLEMVTIESRLRALIAEHLDLNREPVLEGGFADAGVSSMDAVAFMRIVEKEFGILIPPEDCSKIGNFQELIAHLEAKTG